MSAEANTMAQTKDSETGLGLIRSLNNPLIRGSEELSRGHLRDIQPPFHFTICATSLDAKPQSGVKIKCLHPRSERGEAIVNCEVRTGQDGIASFVITKGDLILDRYYWFSISDPHFIGSSEVGISPIGGQFEYSFTVIPTETYHLLVVDNNDTPIPNAQIWLDTENRGTHISKHAVANAQGSATIDFCSSPTDIYVVSSHHASALVQSVGFVKDNPFVLHLIEGAAITGRLVNDERKPIPGNEIKAEKDAPYHDRKEFILSDITEFQVRRRFAVGGGTVDGVHPPRDSLARCLHDSG